MVLVDTSVWVSHLHRGEPQLATLLEAGQVCCHPLVVGELACGSLRNRAEILRLLQALPAAEPVEHDEAIRFVETHRLMGKGLGYVDAQLLAAAVLSGVAFWTADRRLAQAASSLGVRWRPD